MFESDFATLLLAALITLLYGKARHLIYGILVHFCAVFD